MFLTVGQNNFGNKIPFHSFEMKLELKDFFWVLQTPFFKRNFWFSSFTAALSNFYKKYEDCYYPDICSALYFWSVNHFIGVVTSQELFSFSSLLDTHFFN